MGGWFSASTSSPLPSPQITSLLQGNSRLGNVSKDHKINVSLDWKELTEVPEWITNEILHPISSVTLNFNAIEFIPGAILTNRMMGESLTELSMAANKITIVPEPISNLVNLTAIDFSGNQIAELPASMGNLHKLRNLYLSCNALTRIPESFEQLLSLESFAVAENQLTETGIHFPENITNLNISQNRLNELPRSFSKLTQLKILDCSENKIQFGLENIQSPLLKKLYLEVNLVSEIPNHLFQIPNVDINVAYNNLTTFPEEGDHMLQNINCLTVTGNNLPKEISLGLKIRCDVDTVPDKIMDNLYLGCWQCAKNKWALKSMGIGHIVTAAKFRPPWPEEFTYHVVPVDDTNSEQIKDYFDDTIEFINNARTSGSGVLIHW